MNLSRRARTMLAVVLVAAVIVAGSAAILSTAEEPGSDKLRVVATIYPLYYFSSEVGGDRTEVSKLIPDNAEPHSWEPTASDMIKVSKARVLVYNGAGLEPWLGTVMSAVSSSDLVAVDSSRNVHLMLSGEVEEMYERAAEALNGTAISLSASPARSDAPAIDETGYYDVALADIEGGKGGHLRLVPAEDMDLRFFVTSSADLTISLLDGTKVECGMESGAVPSHPMFGEVKFVELKAGTEYVLELRSSSDRAGLVVVRAEHDGGEKHEHGLNDPHFWLDPLSAKVQVRNIMEGFIEADPEHADEYRANAADLTERLDALDQAYAAGLEGRAKNAIITTHEAFNYLAARYGFEAYAATGISADAQPSAKDMAALVKMVQDHGLHYVFSDPAYSDAEMRTIASETGATVLILDTAAGRSGIHAGMDYFGIMYANLEQLRIGLEAA